MSSEYVRDAFRDSWSTLVPTIPFHDVINIDPDHENMEDLWASAEFLAFNETPVSLGSPSCRRENGTIVVELSGKAGEGDTSLSSAVETVRDAYRHWSSGSLRVTQVDPPLPDSGFSDGGYYVMTVDISYVYDLFI